MRVLDLPWIRRVLFHNKSTGHPCRYPDVFDETVSISRDITDMEGMPRGSENHSMPVTLRVFDTLDESFLEDCPAPLVRAARTKGDRGVYILHVLSDKSGKTVTVEVPSEVWDWTTLCETPEWAPQDCLVSEAFCAGNSVEVLKDGGPMQLTISCVGGSVASARRAGSDSFGNMYSPGDNSGVTRVLWRAYSHNSEDRKMGLAARQFISELDLAAVHRLGMGMPEKIEWDDPFLDSGGDCHANVRFIARVRDSHRAVFLAEIRRVVKTLLLKENAEPVALWRAKSPATKGSEIFVAALSTGRVVGVGSAHQPDETPVTLSGLSDMDSYVAEAVWDLDTGLELTPGYPEIMDAAVKKYKRKKVETIMGVIK